MKNRLNATAASRMSSAAGSSATFLPSPKKIISAPAKPIPMPTKASGVTSLLQDRDGEDGGEQRRGLDQERRRAGLDVLGAEVQREVVGGDAEQADQRQLWPVPALRQRCPGGDQHPGQHHRGDQVPEQGQGAGREVPDRVADADERRRPGQDAERDRRDGQQRHRPDDRAPAGRASAPECVGGSGLVAGAAGHAGHVTCSSRRCQRSGRPAAGRAVPRRRAAWPGREPAAAGSRGPGSTRTPATKCIVCTYRSHRS